MSITYKTFDKDYLIVFSDEKHNIGDFMGNVEGIYSNKEGGYIVPKANEKALIKITNYMNTIEKSASTKDRHKKYHKEDEYIEEKHVDIPSTTQKKKYKEKDPLIYYKSFSSKPSDFNKLHKVDDSENEYYSSSSCDESSSDGFPSPDSPKKKHNLDDIVSYITSIDKRLTKIEKMLQK